MSDTIIVGAGPAGMATALGLASSGHAVTVVDEWSNPGGCLTYEPESSQSAPLRADLHAAVDHPGIELLTGTTVWATFPHADGFEVHLNQAGMASVRIAATLILATGTTDTVQPIPGGTLPGVFTERAFRILVNRHHILPGRQIALVGGTASSRLAADISRWKLDARVTNLSTKSIATIDGASHVERIALTNGTTVAADCVVLAQGEAPDLQLAGPLGLQPAYVAEHNAWFADSIQPVPNMFLVGGALLGGSSWTALQQSVTDVVSALLAPSEISA